MRRLLVPLALATPLAAQGGGLPRPVVEMAHKPEAGLPVTYGITPSPAEETPLAFRVTVPGTGHEWTWTTMVLHVTPTGPGAQLIQTYPWLAPPAANEMAQLEAKLTQENWSNQIDAGDLADLDGGGTITLPVDHRDVLDFIGSWLDVPTPQTSDTVLGNGQLVDASGPDANVHWHYSPDNWEQGPGAMEGAVWIDFWGRAARGRYTEQPSGQLHQFFSPPLLAEIAAFGQATRANAVSEFYQLRNSDDWRDALRAYRISAVIIAARADQGYLTSGGEMIGLPSSSTQPIRLKLGLPTTIDIDLPGTDDPFATPHPYIAEVLNTSNPPTPVFAGKKVTLYMGRAYHDTEIGFHISPTQVQWQPVTILGPGMVSVVVPANVSSHPFFDIQWQDTTVIGSSDEWGTSIFVQ